MSEPQIPGTLQGVPSEGNPALVIGVTQPGYVEGPTPNMQPYALDGNPTVNQSVPMQRSYQRSGEWKW